MQFPVPAFGPQAPCYFLCGFATRAIAAVPESTQQRLLARTQGVNGARDLQQLSAHSASQVPNVSQLLQLTLNLLQELRGFGKPDAHCSRCDAGKKKLPRGGGHTFPQRRISTPKPLHKRRRGFALVPTQADCWQGAQGRGDNSRKPCAGSFELAALPLKIQSPALPTSWPSSPASLKPTSLCPSLRSRSDSESSHVLASSRNSVVSSSVSTTQGSVALQARSRPLDFGHMSWPAKPHTLKSVSC